MDTQQFVLFLYFVIILISGISYKKLKRPLLLVISDAMQLISWVGFFIPIFWTFSNQNISMGVDRYLNSVSKISDISSLTLEALSGDKDSQYSLTQIVFVLSPMINFVGGSITWIYRLLSWVSGTNVVIRPRIHYN